jgi:Uma2 family endonuclease
MAHMAAEQRVEWFPHGHPFTRADLDAMPDDGNRYELVDGALVVTPSPSWRHQTAVTALWLRLYNACPAEFSVFVAPLDVVYADDTVLQPDVLVVRRSDLGDRNLEGDPVLAVEVLSPSTRHVDLAFKRARYEAAGCPSYWVIDPLEPSITCWELRDGQYVQTARSTGSQPVTVGAPFPITLAPADLIN